MDTKPRSRPNLVIDGYRQYYFSGSQCRVYFDGVHVSDANYVEYTIATNKAPIYSYNDPYYKLVARGNYLVQGNFHINFTERGKLVRVMNEIKSQKAHPATADVDFKAMRGADDIARFLDSATNIDKEAVLRKYEERYWGVGNSGPLRVPRMDEWDLLPNGDVDAGGFDIVMVFGVPGGPPNEYSVKVINSVHVTNTSMVTNSDGNPLMEQYSFFARSIDMGPTTYYPEEPKPPKEEMREPRNLMNWPVSCRAEAEIEESGIYWTAKFFFNSNDYDVRIGSVDPEGIVFGNTDTNDIRTPDDIRFSPDEGYEQEILYGFHHIPWHIDWVELREPSCFLEHDVEPGVTYVAYNIQFDRSGPIRVYRPQINDELPIKVP